MNRLGALALAGVLLAGCTQRTAGSEDRLGLAVTACQEFVRQRLKAPTTAQFPAPTGDLARLNEHGDYAVSSYVDAQNSFGAMLRMPYTCTVRHEGGNWTLLDLQVQQP